MESERRHPGHHHKSNVKYGVIVFGISLVAAILLAVSNYVYLNKWVRNGAPRQRSIWARLGSPKPLWLHLLIWLIVTLALSVVKVHDIKEHYSTIIKRLGRVGFYLVPFDILLAIRPSLLATSYLEYISIHKWILRLILLLVTLHGIGYFAKWIITNNIWQKSTKTLNFLGVVVFFLGLVLAIFSLRPIRRRVYRVFYLWHNITVAAFMILIFWHARPGVADAVILSLCLVVFQLVQRIRNCNKGSQISISDEKSSSLLVLRLPVPKRFPSQWQAGAHTRISYPLTDVRFWLFPSHPFTIFSLPGDKSLDLVVNKSHRFHLPALQNYTISNPYASLPPPFFQTAEKVIILCGGSGISLGIPIFRILKSNASIHSELHWSVANKADAFVLPSVKRDSEINVYVTKNSSMMLQSDDAHAPNHALLSNIESLELESFGEDSGEVSESFGEAEKKYSENNTGTRFHSGRPVIGDIFSPLLEGFNKENYWIVVCGPESMINVVKKWGKDNEILVFLEKYDF
ncbi:hypothetical protein METBIDRAFT_30105 [Metschnikowia bicuspidata var. bicuspidata NRRL YB-4993]|uniref:Probable metalloreductase AIM14 n=1 Tax=Metschnikowia bicuspidata var. bicuspidata NRRL YB-4993 TaxID=869754 RepID=A0A1A0HI49_9ASCO|nr:hypothetical protein METBIDRAFT_30105 [Metschnikowia bicuspidata var. bicuspidata NRRL YB-4993]OBA23676.1 hypothetical protein METBIDRAFT_30105 [Metschnikowia bicuspidata var. bicuspidata NRRL YB-4993]